MTEDPEIDESGDESPNAESDATAGEMTPEELAEAKEYGRRGLAVELAGRVVDLVFLVVVAFVLGRPESLLMTHVASAVDAMTLKVAAVFLALLVANMAISFPLSFYGGFLLERQFKLLRLSLPGWLWKYAKRRVLEIAFGLVLIPGLYWLIWLTGSWWWLCAAVAFFAISIILGQLAPVLILPLFYKIDRLDAGDPENAELVTRMNRLADGTGLSIEGVYRMQLSDETVKANAMLSGLGRTRRVILGDTVLDQFSADEIEVVLAHEIGHHVYRHIRKLIVMGAILSAAGFWTCDAVLRLWIARQGVALDYAQFPVWTLPVLMLVLSLFSTVFEPLQNAISRRFERQCDRYALDRTGLTGAYRAAFQKLARINKDDPEPNKIEVFLFHSHPPIAERLAMAEKLL